MIIKIKIKIINKVNINPKITSIKIKIKEIIRINNMMNKSYKWLGLRLY